MLEWIGRLMDSVLYVGAVIVAGILVGSSLQRRKLFWLKLMLFSVVIVGVSFAFEELVSMLVLPTYGRVALRTSNCVLVFLSASLLIWRCYECGWWQSLFCVAAGYCMEHFSYRLRMLLELALPWVTAPVVSAVFIVLTRAVVYVPMYLMLFRRVRLGDIHPDHRLQVVLAALIVMFAIYVSSFFSIATRGFTDPLVPVLSSLYSMALCAVSVFVEYFQVFYHQMRTERDVLQQIIAVEAQKYQKEKATIDVINLKYHDLKHHLHRLEEQYGREQLQDMRQAINSYSSVFRTGCVALDVVLAMKQYVCLNKGIQMTCMACAENLKSMSEADVYTLFGNMLDNAIEAVETLPESRRIVSLNVRSQKSFTFIHCENYCNREPLFKDDMPQTTKEDKEYHGFGTRSLKTIAEKYNGICSFGVKDSIFCTDIVISV